ncbi:uncharacterized protein F4812DRAFT_458400 [Daldinia caldariorum]|uniref:uncharacterized protein n=1 Tax=Daldinia caldariorum TaxID=326644 RepID=UPI002008552E|nr:uncharacterized protein F4812DRAFT_458400 [Daldinia caldariorum]KAI1468873.1 hypothetical protein F4812DRAFT_458400 [Daldinia caldariorum]
MPKERSKCWWCLPSQDLQGRDGWFKSPRDTSVTIDSTINGKSKPSGYDSNSLITILRSSQCFTALMVLVLYVFTSSVPIFWLIFYTVAEVVLASAWSIFVLFLRHRWSVWLVIPEFVITVAWVVLFAMSSLLTPDESKESTFRLSLIAIEASMVLWLQTCFLVLTPFFHKLMPCLFQVRNRGGDNFDEGGAREMQMFPPGGPPPGPPPGWPLPPQGLVPPPMDGPGGPGRALGMPHKAAPGMMMPPRRETAGPRRSSSPAKRPISPLSYYRPDD